MRDEEYISYGDRYCDLLATRTMTLDEFLHSEKQTALYGEGDSAIPVLLLPGETTKKYEHKFELWLLRRNVTMGSLRGDPEVERRFRLDFANSRGWELRRQQILRKHEDKIRNYPERQISRSRRELLATEVVSANMLLEINEYEGLNGRLKLGEKLRPIPIVLNRIETSGDYEDNFKRWLNTRRVTLAMLDNNAEEERRYRQCFAYVRASQQTRVVRGREQRRREHSNRFRSPTSSSRSRRSRKRSTSREFEKDQKEKRPRLDSDNLKTVSSPGDEVELLKSSPRLFLQNKMNGAEDEVSCEPVKRAKDCHNDIIQEARKLVGEATQVDYSRTNMDLISDYTSLSEQIALNDAVMKDAWTCANLGSSIAGVNARDQMSDIKELAELVAQAKQRRDASLAAIIAEEWGGRRHELEMLREDSSASQSSHEMLASIYSKLKESGVAIQRLQVKLSNRLSWIPAADTSSQSQLEEIEKLTHNLEEALTLSASLTEQRKMVIIDLLRSNEELQMLTTELIEEAEHIWE